MNSITSIPKQKISAKRSWISNSSAILNDRLAFLQQLEADSPALVQLKALGKNWTIIQEPEAFRYILQKNSKNFRKVGGYRMFKAFLGNGLAINNGASWLHQRRLMQPAFHRDNLNMLFDVINQETSSMICEWKQYKANQVISIDQEFLKLTLVNVVKVLFSTDVKDRLDEICGILRRLESCTSNFTFGLFNLPLWIPLAANQRFKKENKKFTALVEDIISRRKNDVELKLTRPYGDLLDMLMQSFDETTGVGMQDQQLLDEVKTIFMIGHETNAQSLTWMFYELASNQQLLQEVRNEIFQIMPHGSLSIEQLSKLKILSAVINETLRKYPPVWIMVRQSIADDNVCGHYIPAGTKLFLNVYGLQNSLKYWRNPSGFDITHFDEDEVNDRHPFSFIPFGAGPRICIGSHFATMVMKVVVCKLLTNFDFILPKNEVVQINPSITLRPKNGVHLQVIPLQD